MAFFAEKCSLLIDYTDKKCIFACRISPMWQAFVCNILKLNDLRLFKHVKI